MTHSHSILRPMSEVLARNLWLAVRQGNVDEVKFSLKQEADPDHQLFWSKEWVRKLRRSPPLHSACENGNLAIVKILVPNVKNVNKGGGVFHMTPVHWACDNGHLSVVVYLAEVTACELDLKDEKMQSPLDRALDRLMIVEDCVDVAHFLICHGCSSDKKNFKHILLSAACHWGKLKIVKELVEQHKVDPNAMKDKDNWTPLHSACRRGSKEVVQYLVEEQKCDVDVTDQRWGKTPLDQAANWGHTDVVEYLLSKNKIAEQTELQTVLAGGSLEVNTSQGVPLGDEDLDAIHKLLEDNKVKIRAESDNLTFEKVQQMLLQKGLKEFAMGLREKLDKVTKEQRHYLKKLEDLMMDKETVDIQYLKVFLVGPPGVGKTTTLDRLLKTIENICSANEYGVCQSTLLANCIQVLAFVTNGEADWLSSKNPDEETKLLFGYLCENRADTSSSEDVEYADSEADSHGKVSNAEGRSWLSKLASRARLRRQSTPTKVSRQLESSKPTEVASNQCCTILPIKDRLQKLIKMGDYSQMAKIVGNTLLNINDIGGQPGFLEMLPALSTGPAMYLVFLDLSKELDKPYKIPFSRDNTIITPFDASYTVEATISQILSAIASVHRISSNLYPNTGTFSERFERFQQIGPVAALIGTHKDKLTEPELKIRQINEALKKIVDKFSDVMVFPSHLNTSFFPVDNYTGTEKSDIGPIREFMNKIFSTHFREASLPIRPKWLILGTVLRKEYKIVIMKDCLNIGEMLEMDHEEIRFSLWYLDCIGTLMHYTNIESDEDDWFKNHIICSPQVLFDSISQLVVASLRTLHSEGYVIEQERKELLTRGQFSIESIEKYCCLNREKPEDLELIPTKQLVRLLNHANLLSPITHTNTDGSKRTTYFMPAILDYESPEKFTDSHLLNVIDIEPILITFNCGFVPTGTFCGLITQLVSRGPNRILGLQWNLVEDSVKRNRVSFYLEFVNKVSLLLHDRCYEIRILCMDSDISHHDLCTHVLSVVLYILRALYKNLVPQIGFKCPCPKHSACREINNLCTLQKSRASLKFLCEYHPVTLMDSQQVWLGKQVLLGGDVKLEVLKFAEEDFSFQWTKIGSRQQGDSRYQQSTLIFQNINENDLGYYRCEVKEAEKAVLTLYRALFIDKQRYYESTTTASPTISYQPSPQTGMYRVKTTTMNELKTHLELTNYQLNLQIEEEDMLKISAHFENVESYLVQLGLSTSQQTDIKDLASRRGTQIAMCEALRLWSEPNPYAATYRALLDRLIDLGKGEVAAKVCSYLKSKCR